LKEFEARVKALDWPAKECIYVHSKVGKWKEDCRVDRKGEIVWLPGYQCLAEVVKEVPSKQGKAYQLYLLDPERHQYVNIMYWDIGSLRHLEELGAKIGERGEFLNAQSCQELLNEALKAAKKAK
jgi:S-formylglutathione hydrolase FrmB